MGGLPITGQIQIQERRLDGEAVVNLECGSVMAARVSNLGRNQTFKR